MGIFSRWMRSVREFSLPLEVVDFALFSLAEVTKTQSASWLLNLWTERWSEPHWLDSHWAEIRMPSGVVELIMLFPSCLQESTL